MWFVKIKNYLILLAVLVDGMVLLPSESSTKAVYRHIYISKWHRICEWHMRGIKSLGVYFDCSKVAFRETIQRLLVFQWGRRSRCYFKAFNEAHIIIFIYVLCLEGPLKWLKYFSHKCRRKAWKESLIHKVTNQLPNTLISNSTKAARALWDYAVEDVVTFYTKNPLTDLHVYTKLTENLLALCVSYAAAGLSFDLHSGGVRWAGEV